MDDQKRPGAALWTDQAGTQGYLPRLDWIGFRIRSSHLDKIGLSIFNSSMTKASAGGAGEILKKKGK